MAKKPPRIRRSFTPQFKKDAVALVGEGRSVKEVARDLGIARSLLAALERPSWARGRGPPSPAPAGSRPRPRRSASFSRSCAP